MKFIGGILDGQDIDTGNLYEYMAPVPHISSYRWYEEVKPSDVLDMKWDRYILQRFRGNSDKMFGIMVETHLTPDDALEMLINNYQGEIKTNLIVRRKEEYVDD